MAGTISSLPPPLMTAFSQAIQCHFKAPLFLQHPEDQSTTGCFKDTEIKKISCFSSPYLICCFWGFVFKQNSGIVWHEQFLVNLSCIFCFPLIRMFFSTMINSELHAEAVPVMENPFGML